MDTLFKRSWIIPQSLFRKGIHFLYKLIEAKSNNEDLKRREFILNVLLFGSVSLSFFATIFTIVDYINFASSYQGASPLVILGTFIFFLVLYLLSRNGFFVLVSYIFVAVYFILATYTIYSWGIDLPQGLLAYVLVIVMSGVLIGTRFVVITTLITSGAILLFGYLQNNLITHPNLYWKQEMLKIKDAFVIVITFGVMALVSWLSNRETEKSLFRARNAERDLRAERNLLEVKVKERTEELEKTQFEKTKQMQNFVEFGRHASGLFHDMVNPVQAAILSLYTLKQNVVKNDPISLVKSVDEVVAQMERAREFINLARNQITRQDINIEFDPEEQIAHVFQMLSFRAKREKVELKYSMLLNQVTLAGNPLSFHRLVSGLVSNAIDAYDGVLSESGHLRIVSVISKKHNGSVHFSVVDSGKGISKKNQDKIFELFFTTKGIEKGTGVGLALSKEIVEKEFNGTISFKSEEGVGSVFTIILPIKRLIK